MTKPVRIVFAIFVALALVVGAIRLRRRFADPTLRIISTPDDYFSLAAVEVFFFLTFMTLVVDTDGWRLAYFLVTAAFLFYVPFSKISHYVYWFFARVLMGVRYGRRGVEPRSGGTR
jgi:nitrate reductase gamma subunit